MNHHSSQVTVKKEVVKEILFTFFFCIAKANEN